MFEAYEALTTVEQERLQEIIRLLYSQTFLLERKYEKKNGRMMPDKNYEFCDRNFELLTEYFAVAGIRLCQDTELGTIYIQGAEGIGEKLPKLATIYLLLLKLIYDEKMAAVSSSVNVITTFGELNGKVGEFRLVRGLSSITEIKRAFAVLKKYQMAEFLDGVEDLREDTRIMIYPCINLVLLREDIEGLLLSFTEDVPEAGELQEEEEAVQTEDFIEIEETQENDEAGENDEFKEHTWRKGETDDGTDETGV